MEKIDMPNWVGDDWTPKEGSEHKDLETMIIITQKKINEIVDWINSQ